MQAGGARDVPVRLVECLADAPALGRVADLTQAMRASALAGEVFASA